MPTALAGAEACGSTAEADMAGGMPAGRSAEGAELGCVSLGICCTGKVPGSAGAEACAGTAGADMDGDTPAWRFAAGAEAAGDSPASSGFDALGSVEGAEACEGTAGADKDDGTPARRSASAGMASSAEARTSSTFRLSAQTANFTALRLCNTLRTGLEGSIAEHG